MHEAHVEVSACIAAVILGFCARMICREVYPFISVLLTVISTLK